MRTVTFRTDIMNAIGHELGIDPAEDINRDHAAAWASFVNAWTRKGWEAFPWPELNLTEERAFREVWDAGTAYLRADPSTGKPDEIFYITSAAGAATTGNYYQVNATAVADPPAGTLPTNGTYFEPMPTPIDNFIAYDQRGKQSIGMIGGIYRTDPRSTTNPLAWPHGLSEFGIDLPLTAGPTVWITYQVRSSKFTSEMYDAAKTYQRNDLVYDPTTGSCYRSLTTNTNQPVTNTAIWKLQPMPYVLAEFVKYGAASRAAEDAATKADLEAQAETALSREIDKLVEQGFALPRYRTGAPGYRAGRARQVVLTPVAVPVI